MLSGRRWYQLSIRTAAFTALGLALAIAYVNLKLDLEIQRLQRPHIYDNQYLLPAAPVLRAAALNHRTAAADVVWVGGVLHVADSHIASRKAPDATLYARTIVELDPLFYKVYGWHAAARIAVAGYPSPDDINAANDLLKHGMKYFPLDWQLPFDVVANYIGFSQHLSPEERLAQLEDGAKYAEIAASLPGRPDHIPLLASSFHRKVARMRAGYREGEEVGVDATPEELEFLARLYVETSSDEIRAFVAHRFEVLNQSEYLERRARDNHAAFHRVWTAGRNYLHPDLFTLVESSPHSDPSTL